MVDFPNAREFEQQKGKTAVKKKASAVANEVPAEPVKTVTYVLLNPDAAGQFFECKVKCGDNTFEIEVKDGQVKTQYKELSDQLVANGYILLETKEVYDE